MPDPSPEFRSLQVLIVDDESFVRTMVKQMLRTLGITNIREASEGASALQEMAVFTPDVVICDLNMEPIDGIVFVQMLRSHREEHLRSVPVIVLSGKSDLGSIKQAASKGINAYLVKPVSLAALRARLTSVVQDGTFVTVQNRPRKAAPAACSGEG